MSGDARLCCHVLVLVRSRFQFICFHGLFVVSASDVDDAVIEAIFDHVGHTNVVEIVIMSIVYRCSGFVKALNIVLTEHNTS